MTAGDYYLYPTTSINYTYNTNTNTYTNTYTATSTNSSGGNLIITGGTAYGSTYPTYGNISINDGYTYNPNISIIKSYSKTVIDVKQLILHLVETEADIKSFRAIIITNYPEYLEEFDKLALLV